MGRLSWKSHRSRLIAALGVSLLIVGVGIAAMTHRHTHARAVTPTAAKQQPPHPDDSTTTLSATTTSSTPTTATPTTTPLTTAKPTTNTTNPALTTAATQSASIAGCPLFPADNPWRTDISNAPLSPYSAAWVNNIGASAHLHPDFGSDPSYGIPYVVVPANQAKVPITFSDYADESDSGPYPVPLNAPVEAGSDAHVLVASGDCHIYELYNASRSANGWAAAGGAVFNLKSNALRPDGWTSADAAGLPVLPGLVRPDEIAAGHIDHALRFTVSRTQKGFIHPATHQAGSSTDANVVPMGARFRLKASFDLSKYHGASLTILTALKQYGMFVADNGSNWYLSGATYTGWNDDDLDQLKGVPGSAFEAVNTGAVLH